MARASLARRRRALALGGAAALALVLGAIGATVALDRRATAAREAPLVAGPIARVLVAREGFADLVLARSGSGDAWRIEAPCALRASAARVGPLVEALRTARLTRGADEIDAEGAGLSSPVATLEVDGARLELGGPDLGGERRYVRRGDAVGFVPEWLGALVGGGMTAFAEPAVVPRGPAAPSGPDGAARVIAADGDPAAAAAWDALEAVQTVEWPLADAPEVLARRTVSLALDDGTELALEVATTGAWHAVREPGAACARIVALDALPG